MEAQIGIAIEQVFKELVADTHSRDTRVADAAHSCLSALLEWKRRKQIDEEIEEVERSRGRHRL